MIPEPSVAQLRAFYDENAENYQSSPSRSFEAVYFAFSSPELPKEPEQFIQDLEQSAAPLELGEFTQVGNRFPKSSFQQTAGIFGKPFAELLFNMPLNAWTGPIESFRGIHYARVTAEHKPEIPPFETMESYLRTDYLMQKSRASQERKIEEMRKNYQVIVEDTDKP